MNIHIAQVLLPSVFLKNFAQAASLLLQSWTAWADWAALQGQVHVWKIHIGQKY